MTGIKASRLVRTGEVRGSHPRTTFVVNTGNYQMRHSMKKGGLGSLRRSEYLEDKVSVVKYFQYLTNWSLTGLAVYNLDPEAFPSP